MELTDSVKRYLRQTADALRGFDRRLFLARTVRLLGDEGHRRAERELGWNRGTLRKGGHELDRGIRCADAFSARGRKRSEELIPRLLDDIRSLIDAPSQTDPTCQSQRLSSRRSAAEVRRQLTFQKGHAEAELPYGISVVEMRLAG